MYHAYCLRSGGAVIPFDLYKTNDREPFLSVLRHLLLMTLT